MEVGSKKVDKSYTFAPFTFRTRPSVIVSHNFDKIPRVRRQTNNKCLRFRGSAQIKQRIPLLVHHDTRVAAPIFDLEYNKRSIIIYNSISSQKHRRYAYTVACELATHIFTRVVDR